MIQQLQFARPPQLSPELLRMPMHVYISHSDNLTNETIPVVVLHEFGEHAFSTYYQSLHKSLGEKYNLLIITLDYVGTFTKFNFTTLTPPYPFISHVFDISQEEKKKAITLLEKFLTNPIEQTRILKEKGLLRQDVELKNLNSQIIYILQLLHSKENVTMDILKALSTLGLLSSPIHCIKMMPHDYEEFGVIQALDVLLTLANLRKIENYKDINWKKLSIVGTSQGGYIASLCKRFAPNSFHTVVDSCGWVDTQKQSQERFYEQKIGDMVFTYENQRYWQDNVNFTTDEKEIRNLNNSLHIKQQKQQIKNSYEGEYICIHSKDDELIDILLKDEYIKNLATFWIKHDYLRLDEPSKLDGKTFKSFNHGANASIKGLIFDFILNQQNENEIEQNDFQRGSLIRYECSDRTFVIDYKDESISMRWE